MNYKEHLLNRVIEDSRKKGAPILKWERSPNGRIVLIMQGQLPRYFFNHLSAIDFLIHSYNLTFHRKNLYRNPNRRYFSSGSGNAAATAESAQLPSEAKLLHNIQKLFDKEAKSFTQTDELFILNAISDTYGWHNVTPDILYTARDHLMDHFMDKLSKSKERYHTHFLRSGIQFLQNLNYQSFSEHF